MRRGRDGFSLVEMLVVLIVIAVLAGFLWPQLARRQPTPGANTPATPIQRAESVECMNNLAQIRQALQMAAVSEEEGRPRSLADLRRYGVAESMMGCPVGRQPYQFNSNTGQVRCAVPDHARY